MKLLSFDYQKALKPALRGIQKHQTSITILVVTVLLFATVLRIDSLSRPEANEEHIQTELSQLKDVKIDDEVVERLRDLDESNVEINPDLNDGRDNPFAE